MNGVPFQWENHLKYTLQRASNWCQHNKVNVLSILHSHLTSPIRDLLQCLEHHIHINWVPPAGVHEHWWQVEVKWREYIWGFIET